jgi:hypothetical protein
MVLRPVPPVMVWKDREIHPIRMSLEHVEDAWPEVSKIVAIFKSKPWLVVAIGDQGTISMRWPMDEKVYRCEVVVSGKHYSSETDEITIIWEVRECLTD